MNDLVQSIWITGNGNQDLYMLLYQAPIDDIYINKQSHQHEEIWSFFKFMMASFIANYFINKKLFKYTFDYLVEAFNCEKENSDEKKFIREKLFEFIQSEDSFIKKQKYFTLVIYTMSFLRLG